MELYGTKLHILCSITGGFILHRNDRWPNVVKICVIVILFAIFYCLQRIALPSFVKFLIALAISIFVLIIELIVVWFNVLLDESIDTNTEENLDEVESVIPPGISGPLWENRNILFNERIPMDDRAYQLVRRGFDADEVFRLVTLVHNGTVTKETRDHAPRRRVRTNLIILCGQSINVHFDRESLSRTFTRPANNWHLLSSIILSFLLGSMIGLLRDSMPSYLYWYVALISASAIFSLLLPPPVDPYSTSFTDPYISYTRASVAVSASGVTVICKELIKYLPHEVQIDSDYTFPLSRVLSLMASIFFYFFLAHPFLIWIGVIGHPITTLHWLIESLNKYLFGICGSVSFKNAVRNFFSSLILVLAVTLFLLIGNHPITIGVSILCVTFFTQFSIADNCQVFMKKHLLTAVLASVISGATSLLNFIIPKKVLTIIEYCILLCHFIIDIAFPYLTTHESYIFFYGRILNLTFLTKYTHYITNFVTAPAFISFTLVENPLSAPFAALLILHGLRIAQTMPHLFCIAIAMALLLFEREVGVNSISVSFLLGLMLARKFIKVLRLTRVWYKLRYVPGQIYQDPAVNPKEFLKATATCEVISALPQILSGFSGPAFAWSILTGSPMTILLGHNGVFTFSPPRPNAFYDFVTGDVNHDEYIKSATTHPLEAPTYLSLSEALEEHLGRLVKDGNLGLVNDDSFFLFTCDDLIAIIHIIAIEANKVSFQVRGLEYVSQTLCHGGELSLLQRIVLEHQTFGNTGHALAFRHSMFQLRSKGIDLDVVSFARASLADTVVPRLGRSFLMWELKALVYFTLKGIKDGLVTDFEEEQSLIADVRSAFSERNMAFVRFVGVSLGVEVDERTVKRLWIVTHFVHSIIVDRRGGFKYDNILSYFDGREELEGVLKFYEPLVLFAFRYSLAVLLLVSVGLEPETGDNELVFQFMQEAEADNIVLPLRSPELEGALREGAKPVITLLMNGDSLEIVRFSKGPTSWSVFELEPEAVRGYWANEARSILFFAMHSAERSSIQAKNESLRNITNQSCNIPVGYPAFVTNIIESYNDKN